LSALNAHESAGSITVNIVVQTRASKAEMGPMRGDRLRVAVTAPPVDGQANEAVIECLAESLGLPSSAVSILVGLKGRRKTVRIKGLTLEEFLKRVPGA